MKKAINALLCAAMAVLIFAASASGSIHHMIGSDLLQTLDNRLSDELMQRPRLPNRDIYVIGIDETSLRELGPWTSWKRDIMADMIDTLNSDPASKPAVIGIDVSYFNHTDPAADARLAQAAAQGGNVVVACEAVFSDVLMYDVKGLPYLNRMQISTLDYPYSELRAATSQGIINTLPESDGVIRNCIHKVSYDGQEIYGFAYEVYKKYAEHVGLPTEINPPLDKLSRMHIPFTAMAGDYYGGNSFVKVLHGDIPPQIYHDAIVLIGPYATGMMDQYYTPIDAGKLMYGAEIHANVIDALIDQNFKSPVSFPLQCLLLGICAALCFLLFCRCDPRLSAVLLVLFSAAYLFLVSFVYRQGYILHVLYLPLTLAVLYFYRMIHSYFSERRRRQTVTDTFKRYMEPRVVEQLLKDGAAQASMEGQKRDIAVLFVDIRGFTAMSEALDTADVVGILNEYLSLASEAIFNNQGTLDKFIGDAAMAIFNAPLDLDDYTYRAVKTALELSAGSEALGARLMERFGRTVSFGIGVNCGEAIVGNIGAHFRLDYTAIGDTVNTAARLEGRAASGQILISDAVYERLRDRIAVTELGPMSFKGKSHEILTYQVDGLI